MFESYSTVGAWRILLQFYVNTQTLTHVHSHMLYDLILPTEEESQVGAVSHAR